MSNIVSPFSNFSLSQVQFIPFKAEHLERFLEIRNSNRSFLHDSREFSLAECSNWFHGNSNNYSIVAFRELILGYFRISSVNEEPTSLFLGLDLAREFQGFGLSKVLYSKFCNDVILPQNISKIYLRVLKSNKRATNLYLGMGMKILEESDVDYLMSIYTTVLIDNLQNQNSLRIIHRFGH